MTADWMCASRRPAVTDRRYTGSARRGSAALHDGREGGPRPVEGVAIDGQAVPDEPGERGGAVVGQVVQERGQFRWLRTNFADRVAGLPVGMAAFCGETGNIAGAVEGQQEAVGRQGDAKGHADAGGAFDGVAGGIRITELHICIYSKHSRHIYIQQRGDWL